MAVADKASAVNAAWQVFIARGRLENTSVSPEILESWQRCFRAGVDPADGICHHLLSPAVLQALINKHRDFIDIARPFMLNLFEFVKGSGFIVVLTDEHGYIIESFGDNDTLEAANRLGFRKGGIWTEKEVGTNAIGTALKLRKPIQTTGAEHYCRKHHTWTCSASPIIYKGQLIGILDMSGPVGSTHLHTLGMVVASAEAILDQMHLHEKNRQLMVANDRMNNVLRTMSDGVMVIDEQGTIIQVNSAAEKIIGKNAADLEGLSIYGVFGQRIPAMEKALLNREGFYDLEIMVDTVSGRVHCVSSGMPMVNEDGGISDVVILVRPIEKVQRLVNRFSGAQATFHFPDIVGRSPQIRETKRLAALAAAGSSNILLEGESGTGKELFAQSIHNHSRRQNGPFVAVNCGAIPRELIGSELFGYSEGAFTGARRGGRPGKFELAAGGTLFLDEIGDMPLEQQVALLRVLQDKNITRIGDDKTIPVDFRLICATNKNLLAEVEMGNFRKDLYYRLNVVPIYIYPLRDHREDIPLLFEHFLETIGRQFGNVIVEVDAEVIEALVNYDWPGNVRELQNVVERLISIAEDGRIHAGHIPFTASQASGRIVPLAPADTAPVDTAPAGEAVSERERKKQLRAQRESREIISLLKKHGGNVSEVAREMALSRNTIYRKMRLYNIAY